MQRAALGNKYSEEQVNVKEEVWASGGRTARKGKEEETEEGGACQACVCARLRVHVCAGVCVQGCVCRGMCSGMCRGVCARM